jgi:hypothetical protein
MSYYNILYIIDLHPGTSFPCWSAAGVQPLNPATPYGDVAASFSYPGDPSQKSFRLVGSWGFGGNKKKDASGG